MKIKFLKNILISTLTIATLFAFAGCGKNSSSSTSAVDKIKKSGKLILATSADYPPYEFHKNINGKDTIVGFDIALAKEIAKDLGVELEIKDMDFQGVLDSISAGKVDIAVAGMNPSPEREKSLDFSNIYYKAIHSVVVKSSDKDKYPTLDSLKSKKIGVQIGTIQEKLAKEQLEGANIKSLPKINDLILELQNNKVDAIIIENPVAKAYADKNSAIALSSIEIKASDDMGSAVGIKKGNKDLVDQVNKTLERLNKDNLIEKFVFEANEMVD